MSRELLYFRRDQAKNSRAGTERPQRAGPATGRFTVMAGPRRRREVEQQHSWQRLEEEEEEEEARSRSRSRLKGLLHELGSRVPPKILWGILTLSWMKTLPGSSVFKRGHCA